VTARSGARTWAATFAGLAARLTRQAVAGAGASLLLTATVNSGAAADRFTACGTLPYCDAVIPSERGDL
jgi:hypothetical protein